MSSRVLSPDDPRTIAPVRWPSAGAGRGPEIAQEAALEPSVDLRSVEREWSARVEEARRAGLREGEALGRNRAAAESQAVLERTARAIDELASMRPRLRREAEADTVKLALAIARRVIRRELSVDPGALHGLLRAALENLEDQEISRVRVHPSQAPAIEALLRGRPAGSTIEVVADSSGDPGAAVFETSRGNLDASVDSQLAEIERGLADTLRRRQ